MKLKDLKNELSNEKQITENGAVGYRTTGKNLLDLNFMASSLRKKSEDEIYDIFTKAFFEDKLLAIKWLFFLRDCRGGLGERRSFGVILQKLAIDYPELVKELIDLVAEYGRYDDLLCLLDTDLKDFIVDYFKETISSDLKNVINKKPITLLAKWLPSVKSKNAEYAKIIRNGFGMSKKVYSYTLKYLRNYLNVVECKMSRNEWNEIEYSKVPSKANLLYGDAFMRHDADRRNNYLSSLAEGKTKINSSVLFPHDIVHKYSSEGLWSTSVKKYNETLEQLWNHLPNYVQGDDSTICVVDGSGSMMTTIDNKSSVSALEVANALGIYFAQNLSGEYKDSFITFSSRPQLVDMSLCNNLHEKLKLAYSHAECSNTNIEAVFDLILNVAIKNNYSQDQLPKNILILSDMEFDRCVCDNNSLTYYCNFRSTLFDEIAVKYKKHGYTLPSLAFWNLCSRTGTIPVKENEMGVKLVSGFSPTVVEMVLSNKTDPYETLLEKLNSERYDMVEQTFNEFTNKKGTQ